MRRISALIRLLVAVALIGVVVTLTTVLVAPQVANVVTSGEWEHTSVDLAETAVRTQVFDVNGQLMATWFKDNRAPIALDQIPVEVKEAILAIEDADFYAHQGVNFKATGRAVVENVDAGGISQGGSTITQQLVKNLVLNDDQTVERKIQEASLAVRLEDQMSKDEILEVYLNTVYFGSGAYGVKAAAEVYFGLETANKTDAQVAAVLDEGLGWGEAALFASLISNPDAYDPTLHPEISEYQRGIVLNRLAELEFVTEEEAALLDASPLPTERQEVVLEAEDDFFVAEVRQLLLKDERFLGGGEESRREALFGGGLRIFTSFDPAAQALAEQARDATLRGEDPNNPRVPYDFTMSIAAVDVKTGAVRAMVGGESFDDENYNIATQGKRQPGSAFKAFTLVAALRQGIQTNDTVNGGGPCKFVDVGSAGGFAEFNNFGRSRGSVNTIRGLTLASSNCGYVRIEQLAGLGNVIETASLLGVDTSEMKEYLSLTLGGFEVTPMDMASAFATVAAGGVAREPSFIERIEDDKGNVIYSVLDDDRFTGQRVITEDVACWATDVLEANVQGGTGTRARLPEQPAAGKTGTTEIFADAWFVGYTPYLATAVWMGNPDSNEVSMRGIGGIGSVTGGSFPAQAWAAFNTPYHENLPVVEFPDCPGFARGGQYKKVEGDVEIGNNPCAENRIPLDTDRDGEPDKCRKKLPKTAYQCSGGVIDDDNEDVQLYCLPKEKKKKKKQQEEAPAAEVTEEPAPAEDPQPAGGGSAGGDDSGLG